MDAVEVVLGGLRWCWAGVRWVGSLISALGWMLAPFEAFYYRVQCADCRKPFRAAPGECPNCGHTIFEHNSFWE